jgi:hypothetical protein
MTLTAAPSWFSRLPEFKPRPGTKVVIVDNQVLSYRLLDNRTNVDYDFLFSDPRVVLQIGRQVINETLHSVGIDDKGLKLNADDRPVLDAKGQPIRIGPVTYRPGLLSALHQRMWTGQAQLQERGKLVLVGAMYPAQRIVYGRLTTIIENVCGKGMGPKDARVIADALVRKIPLFSADNRARDAFTKGIASTVLSAELCATGLTAFAASMFVP